MTYAQQPYDQSSQQSQQNQLGQSTNEPPVGEPYFGVGFGKALKRFFAGYVKFNGRASRSEFWWAQLWQAIIFVIPMTVYFVGAMVVAFSTSYELSMYGTADAEDVIAMFLEIIAWSIPMVLVSLALLLPSYAIFWRRLHDAGFSGLFALLSLLGLSIIPTIMCIMPTSHEATKYGPGATPQPPQFAPQSGMYPPQNQYPQQNPYGNQYPPQ